MPAAAGLGCATDPLLLPLSHPRPSCLAPFAAGKAKVAEPKEDAAPVKLSAVQSVEVAEQRLSAAAARLASELSRAAGAGGEAPPTSELAAAGAAGHGAGAQGQPAGEAGEPSEASSVRGQSQSHDAGAGDGSPERSRGTVPRRAGEGSSAEKAGASSILDTSRQPQSLEAMPGWWKKETVQLRQRRASRSGR